MNAVKREIETLTFARVTRVVLDEKHRVGKTYTHFYGFAKNLDDASQSIWFRKAGFVGNMDDGGFYFGPVLHRPLLEDNFPEQGDIVVGITVNHTKGLAFKWWVHQAMPFRQFSLMLRENKPFHNLSRAYSRLCLPTEHPDDLYMLGRLLLCKDTDTLASQLKEASERPRHPVSKDDSGYQRRRGFLVSMGAVEFAFFSCLFSRDAALFETFVSKIDKEKHKLNVYTPQRLERMIDKISA